MIDIIIPVFNQREITSRCLKSIEARSDVAYRLILIDNASSEETAAFLTDFAAHKNNVVLVRNGTNSGWVKAVNQGIGLSDAPYVLIMNNDTVVKSDRWLSGLVMVSEAASDIGLVNPRFDSKRDSYDKMPFVEIDFCRGYCVLIKRGVINKIGLLDESYGMGYYDDDDYSVRAIRAGFRCVRANSVFVEHLRDSTFKSVMEERERLKLHEANKELFYSKWGRRLNTVFILTRAADTEKVGRTLLALARRQHIVYLWNFTSARLNIAHTNIRQARLPRILSRQQIYMRLKQNMLKDRPKRYAVVFADDARISAAPSGFGGILRFVGPSDTIDSVIETADSEARRNR